MIVLNPRATFQAPVEVRVPGREEPATATFTFRVLENATYLQLLIAMGFGKFGWWRRLRARVALCWRLRTLVNLADVLAEIVDGWDGFDEPYTREALQRLLLAFPGVGMSILVAYMEHRQGARIKN